jgi:hypothetical protein
VQRFTSIQRLALLLHGTLVCRPRWCLDWLGFASGSRTKSQLQGRMPRGQMRDWGTEVVRRGTSVQFGREQQIISTTAYNGTARCCAALQQRRILAETLVHVSLTATFGWPNRSSKPAQPQRADAVSTAESSVRRSTTLSGSTTQPPTPF